MSGTEENKILISEDFYSIQGEGITTGVPAYFLIATKTCAVNLLSTKL